MNRGLLRSIAILLLVITYGIFIPVNGKKAIYRNFDKNSEITIGDFSDFEILADDPNISSLKSNEQIQFTYSGGASDRVVEYFYLNFDEYGNCTDFSVEVNVSYNYTGSYLSGGLFLLGSYYFENGSYFGKPEEDLFTYLGWTSVRDVFLGYQGLFEVCGYPNNIGDKHQSSDNSAGTAGNATFLLSRDNSVLTLSVKQGTTTRITHSWFTNVSRVINYIQLGLTIKNPAYINYSNFNVTSINGTFNIVNTTTIPSFIFPGFSTITVLCGLTFIGLIVFLIRKKSK